MKSILNFFTPKSEMSLYDKQKTNAFIILGILGFVIVLLMAIQSLIAQNENFLVSLISSLTMGAFVVICLFILKSYGIKLAGNIFATGLVLLLTISLNILKEDVPAIYKYLQGFYTILAILSIGVLFASRKLLILNASIVLITTIRVYLYAIKQNPADEALFQVGLTNHTTSLIIITTLIYFAIQFAEKAIDAATKDAKINKEQNKQLNEIFTIVKETSLTLERLSDEINTSANSLTTSASQQASNVEEITSTIEEMTSSVVQNSEETQQTAALVNNTANSTQKSQQAINQTLEAIKNVDDKISLIQDIAFQTNILALNASVEAARAGEHGKGFSVVASEVKKLAENSADGAKDIIELINATLKVSDEAGKYQKMITSDIEGIDSSINQISVSSQQLKNSIEQINKAVYQINEGAQNNAAISEQLAGSIEQLSQHAHQLNDAIQRNSSNG